MKKKPTRKRAPNAAQRTAAATTDTPKKTPARSIREPAAQYVALDKEFRPLKDEIIKADARGRITVGNEASEKQFRVMINDEGQILLDPVVVIPAREAWLFKNPQAAISVLRGIEQSRAGKTKSLGSFKEFADIEDDA